MMHLNPCSCGGTVGEQQLDLSIELCEGSDVDIFVLRFFFAGERLGEDESANISSKIERLVMRSLSEGSMGLLSIWLGLVWGL